jgi:cbb3-type cytochrome oxidase subunit 3
MRMSDHMSQAGLALFAEIALVIFVLCFLGIVAWVYWPGRKQRWMHDARLPLDDTSTTPAPGKGRSSKEN